MSIRCLLFASLALSTSLAHANAGSCKYVPVAELPIRFAGGMPTIQGSINGTPATMLLDTGASQTEVTRGGADRRQLTLFATGKYLYGVGGASQVYGVKLDEFSVGPARQTRIGLPVSGQMVSMKDIDAVVGADFALGIDAEIALAQKAIRFYQASGCGDTFLAYWDQNALEVPMDQLSDRDTRARIAVLLNGVRMTALIDTGASITVVTHRAAERAGAKPDGATLRRQTRGYGAEAANLWTAPFIFTLGDETVKNARLAVLEDSSTGNMLGDVDMVLGQDWLRAHRVLLSRAQGKMYFSYLGGDLFSQ